MTQICSLGHRDGIADLIAPGGVEQIIHAANEVTKHPVGKGFHVLDQSVPVGHVGLADWSQHGAHIHEALTGRQIGTVTPATSASA
jgi:hypothetical protein